MGRKSKTTLKNIIGIKAGLPENRQSSNSGSEASRLKNIRDRLQQKLPITINYTEESEFELNNRTPIQYEIDRFKAYNKSLCQQAEKKGNYFEAWTFGMMDNAIEEVRAKYFSYTKTSTNM
ncbi:hypothetical protein Glove_120g48 [Diversispora epigaea]|uniref:Uncharacterized protein n=1 Tax=Diversispora epigaea TaxID=1348612 RepID=A0A397J5Y6_9GLOM|nr:hypothetical protein Glove_120g48 [Diversispora epigaea]